MFVTLCPFMFQLFCFFLSTLLHVELLWFWFKCCYVDEALWSCLVWMELGTSVIFCFSGSIEQWYGSSRIWYALFEMDLWDSCLILMHWLFAKDRQWRWIVQFFCIFIPDELHWLAESLSVSLRFTVVPIVRWPAACVSEWITPHDGPERKNCRWLGSIIQKIMRKLTKTLYAKFKLDG